MTYVKYDKVATKMFVSGHKPYSQINWLVGVQTLAWFYQTKAWTPFSESL